MNPLEYLILGFLVVMAVGAWVLIQALLHAEDAFETELGYQIGFAPPVKSLEAHPAFVQVSPPRATVPEMTTIKPRRPPSSKPPMLPVGMTVADLDTRQTGAPWQQKQPPEPIPPVSSESQVTAPATPPRSPDAPAGS